jgi:hypothetical protein
MQRRSQGRTIRPRVEPLEARTLLATCHVTRLGDFGAGADIGGGHWRGDLRFCITKANVEPGPDIITFSRTGVINLAGPLPDVASDIDIQGPGAELLTIRRNSGGDYRIFTVAAGTVGISGLAITNGNDSVGGGIYNQATLALDGVSITSNTSTAGQGGGIYNTGTLDVANSIISQNLAKGPDAGYGGGIYNSQFGNTTILSSTIADNQATGFGAPFWFSGYGGGLFNDGSLVLDDTAVSGNSALTTCNSVCPGYDVAGGGIYNSAAGSLDIQNSSISDNRAQHTHLSPANRSLGGGIFSTGAATITNTTIEQNLAETLGGTAQGGGIYSQNLMVILDSALVDNHANTTTGNARASGGGIYHDAGDLEIHNSTISGNVADATTNGIGADVTGYGGGVHNGSTGDVIVTTSLITDNTAGGSTTNGGAPGAIAAGGGIYNVGLFDVADTTISGNLLDAKAGFGDATAHGAGIMNLGTLDVDRSTMSDNIAMSCVYDFGFSIAYGGAIYQENGVITVAHSTLANNTATAIAVYDDFDTVAAGGGVFATGAFSIGHSTIANNEVIADDPGAGGITGDGVSMHHTIVAGNTGGSAPDIECALDSSAYNLIGNSNGGSGYSSTDLLDANPLLAPLADNGGPTMTMALLPGSPAIDAGDPNPTDPPAWDQRGTGFPRIVNGRIDIGAYEVQATGSPGTAPYLAFLITADWDDE